MEEADRVQAALNRSWWFGRMDRVLTQGFEARTGESRRRNTQTPLACMLFLILVCLPLNNMANVLHEGLVLGLGVEAPMILGSMWVLRRDRPIWLQGLAAGAPVAIIVACVVVLGLRSTPLFTERYVTVAGMLGFVTNLVMPLRLRHAACLAACNVTIYCGLCMSGVIATPSDQLSVLAGFFSLVMILTLNAARLRERDSEDRYLFTLRDALQNRELARLVEQLTRLADRDPLTDIGNRRCFDRMFDLLWGDAQVDSRYLGLAMIDVDVFKRFNDAAGHAAGDRCLRAVARAISAHVRTGSDIPTRYGGEEFAVLMPLLATLAESTAELVAAGERIRHAVEALGLVHPGIGPDGRVTVSIGLAIAAPGRDGHSGETLLEAADRALYEAKRSGRNRVILAEARRLAAAA